MNPKLDLTPYRGAWDMTPAEIDTLTGSLIRQSLEAQRLAARARVLIEEGRTSDAEKLVQEVQMFSQIAIDRYIDVLFSTMRNRVRAGR
ncbi:hypothetical protein [Staphylococcus aureus]|uniref:hypothetical protein n=1 Tax=Staphylococcus aureus TaxID=1280 RepID=UPI0012A16ABE|nr:hypothetical protein [Staphylococcus aureus]AYD82562.1 hypothetical protein ART_00093 [Achromobacter phage vB_Ade_ART]MBD4204905.1 hypothetical protein [Xanthomonas citri pv. citri]